MYRTAFNPGTTPVVVDGEGHSIGGQEWGTYQTTEDAAKQALEHGWLVAVDAPADDQDTSRFDVRALEAHKHTALLNERSETVKTLDKETLHEVAVEAGLVDEDEKIALRDLREAVTEATEQVEVDVPKKSTRKREA